MAPFTWNFPGAYPVVFMVGVACTAGIYNSIRNIAYNPDCRWNSALKRDELATEQSLLARAQAYYPNAFRFLGETRTIEKGGAGGSDCRIFRF